MNEQDVPDRISPQSEKTSTATRCGVHERKHIKTIHLNEITTEFIRDSKFIVFENRIWIH